MAAPRLRVGRGRHQAQLGHLVVARVPLVAGVALMVALVVVLRLVVQPLLVGVAARG